MTAMTLNYNNQLEENYSAKTSVQYRRSLGQFFTPFQVACFMADWILGAPQKKLTVLDPSAGLGMFERAVNFQNKDKRLSFDLWEIDKNVAAELKDVVSELKIKAAVHNSDFLAGSWGEKYDGIIANPPYYKHHFIPNKKEVFQKICSESQFEFSIQTNVYCWFLIKSIKLLNDDGRLAFIIPSEFMNANYGEKVKEYLIGSGISLRLINVHFEKTVFDNALTTSLIILGEKKRGKSDAIDFYSVSDVKQLNNLSEFLKRNRKRKIANRDLNPRMKWRNYFNGYKQRDSGNLVSFSKIGKFSRGIATGANHYFTLTPQEIDEYNISYDCLHPCITKANFVKGIIFSRKNFDDLGKQNKKTYLFDGEKATDEECRKYIRKGEVENIHHRFLTKSRSPWYALEKREKSNIWVSVFGRKGLKFVWNTSNCKSLTCFHSFYPTAFGKKYLDILFIYLNTRFAHTLFDREKREYGNGLGKFEPNDINKSLILDFGEIEEEDFQKLKELQKDLLLDAGQKNQDPIQQADLILKESVMRAA